jgi:NAD+ synthase (glutamine-hydrolysing)
MKIAIAQINTRVGDFNYNRSKIIEAIRRAKEQSADILAFPNHVLSGFPLSDLSFYHDFLERQNTELQNIAQESVHIRTIIGRVSREAKKVAVLYNGEIEYSTSLSIDSRKIAIIQTDDPQTFDENSDIILQLGSSTFQYQKIINPENNRSTFERVCNIFVNRVGGEVGIIFDGGSSINIKDNLYKLPYFEEAYALIDVDKNVVEIQPLGSSGISLLSDKISFIYKALVLGIRDFFEKQSFRKAIIGLSGGIDSAVVAALATEALGSENVWGILLPSQFSTDHSIKDAEDLAHNLSCKYDIIPVESGYHVIYQEVKHIFRDLPFGLAEENIQARIRAVIIMALSNKFGHIMLNTSNKSELAVGYGTLYGDSCGALSVMGDLYKTDVYALAHYINREQEIIPINTILKPPSAELKPDQKDSDSLPPYDILDAILYDHIEGMLSASEIVKKGYDPDLVSRILKMVASNEYKRKQAPPIISVSSKTFGVGRNIPLSSLWNGK